MKEAKTLATLLEEAQKELRQAHSTIWSKWGEEAERLASRRPWLHPHQASRYLELLGPHEAEALLGVDESQLLSTIRVNTLRIEPRRLAERLTSKGFRLSPHPYIDYGLAIVEAPYSPGASLEYLAGLYTIQGPASMLAVPSIPLDELGPSPRLLDMCSGAGVKTTQLAQHRPDAAIAATDINRRKLAALRNNASRLGHANIVAIHMDARHAASLGRFDAVLLDAPCSGEGLLPYPKGRWPRSFSDIRGRVNLQLQLLWAALDAAKPGAPILYSTCSIAVEENEYVISKILQARSDAEPDEPRIKAGDPGVAKYSTLPLDPAAAKACRRLYPHRHRTEGFTICLLRRRG